MPQKKLIVISGPTASGKTPLAIWLAKQLETEIVSADSRQVYREMQIGTAKPSADELNQVPHHFISSRSITDEYDAGTYGREALALILQLFKTHDHVILCGGSGLYISAVCDCFDDMPQVPEGVREAINAAYQQHGLAWLQQEVEAVDPEFFAKADRRNPQRLIRALELSRATGKPASSYRIKKQVIHPFDIVKIALNVDRPGLYQRIDQRVDQMLEAGLVEEARKLYPQKNLNALQTVGYQEFFDSFDGRHNLEEAVRLVKRNTRQYAKRQMTWLKRDQENHWLSPTDQKGILALALLPVHEQ